MLVITGIIALALAAYRRDFPASLVSDETFARYFHTHDVCSESGRLFPKGRYTTEYTESPLATLHMRSVNPDEILSGGHTYTMQDSESPFDDETGELRGVQFEASTMSDDVLDILESGATPLGMNDYQHEDVERWMLDSAGCWFRGYDVTDATDKRVEDFDLLTDNNHCDWETVVIDGTPVQRTRQTPGRFPLHAPANMRQGTGPDRWAWELEIAQDTAEQESHRISMPLESGRDYGEQGSAAMLRERRTSELCHFARKTGIILRRARSRRNQVAVNRAQSILSRIKTGARARYNASVKLIVTRGEESGQPSSRWEWWALYLSKAQLAQVVAAVDTARNGIRLPNGDVMRTDDGLEPASRALLGKLPFKYS